MKTVQNPAAFFLLLLLFSAADSYSQACTTLGQNPATAFPVCGTTTFEQNNVPICGSENLYVPGCSGSSNADYANKNPFWYKFTCYQSGTLGFIITPNDLSDDYDWQLYDITGHNPNDVYTDHSIIVTGNWSGSFGTTGASASGANSIQCASIPADNVPTFTQMPALIAGHQYLLLISHFTDSQSGYSLSFGGGTAVITDPATPHLQKATPDCDGRQIILKLNKKIKCPSLTATGSEFSISPAVTTVVSANANSCSASFDFDEVTITLANPLPAGDYQLIINNGSDGNTLFDDCGLSIPAGEQTPFHYDIPQPTPIDSISKIGCAPDTIELFFSKRIQCSSIAADGSDFTVSGPTPVTVIAATGNCVNGLSDVITVKFAAPVYTKGNYLLTLETGADGNTVVDECGQETLTQTIPFITADTVSADFTYTSRLGCRSDTFILLHDGAHDVNEWKWTFNNSTTSNTQTVSVIFPASGTNSIDLSVSNGVCRDSAATTLVLDNEVKAAFEMTDVICPQDPVTLTNTSTGLVDSWLWKFDVIGSSTLKDPPPLHFPDNNNRELYYSVKLIATNVMLNCSDSVKKTVRVLNNCFIAVPTAFTPNGDGLNDFLFPNNALKADNLEFKVYNRWGQLVFASNNWLQKWDGKLNGSPQGAGIYVWFLRYTFRDTGQKVFQKGTTMLIR